MTIVRSLWLFVGVALTTVAMLIASTAVWQIIARADEPTEHKIRTIPVTGTKLKIEVMKGGVNLAIEPGPAGELTLDRELRWSGQKPTVVEDWDGSVLRLSATCPEEDKPRGPTCLATYVVFVPPETELEASTMSGSLGVRGLYGAMRLSSVSGNVDVSETPAGIWVRTGTGNISGRGLRGGAADAEAGNGDIRLDYNKPPSSVSAVVRASGDIQLDVPQERYDVSVTADAITTVDVTQDATSSRKIVARTSEGAVWVTGF